MDKYHVWHWSCQFQQRLLFGSSYTFIFYCIYKCLCILRILHYLSGTSKLSFLDLNNIAHAAFNRWNIWIGKEFAFDKTDSAGHTMKNICHRWRPNPDKCDLSTDNWGKLIRFFESQCGFAKLVDSSKKCHQIVIEILQSKMSSFGKRNCPSWSLPAGNCFTMNCNPQSFSDHLLADGNLSLSSRLNNKSGKGASLMGFQHHYPPRK